MGTCTCRATKYGFMEIPAPTMPPMTTGEASNRPGLRASVRLATEFTADAAQAYRLERQKEVFDGNLCNSQPPCP